MQTTTIHPTHPLEPAGPRTALTASRARSLLAALGATLRLWLERHRSRSDLRAVLLFYTAMHQTPPWPDLGGTRGELLYEAGKPFWRE
jgi:uncharacterized protein YjiS (DUF1127 family)